MEFVIIHKKEPALNEKREEKNCAESEDVSFSAEIGEKKWCSTENIKTGILTPAKLKQIAVNLLE